MADFNSTKTGAEIDAGVDTANAALPKSGGVMSGDITLSNGKSANTTGDLALAALPKSGGTLTGSVTTQNAKDLDTVIDNADALFQAGLNDYEEGTWTPALGGTWTVNPTGLTGRYKKIGSAVHVELDFLTGSKASATSGYFTGLPFAVVGGAAGSEINSNIESEGAALAANTDRIWVEGVAFTGTVRVSVTYFV